MSQKYEELEIIESVPEVNIEIHKTGNYGESNQLLTSEEFSDPTYRSAASDFDKHDVKNESEAASTKLDLKNLEVAKPEEKKCISPRLVTMPSSKSHRSRAYTS